MAKAAIGRKSHKQIRSLTNHLSSLIPLLSSLPYETQANFPRCLPAWPWASQCVFIKDGPEVVVVDTSYKGSETQILAAVETLGYAPTAVKNILITHCHPDHAGSLAALQTATGAMCGCTTSMRRWRAAVPAWVRPSPHRGYSAKFCSASSSKALTRITQRPKLPKNW
ncbi:MAG: MBL fold metallo-hydrolase [Chloroflexi bacterium]|nr:MBL fold metallo-hydrolase [Chloroflexota bacterium]